MVYDFCPCKYNCWCYVRYSYSYVGLGTPLRFSSLRSKREISLEGLVAALGPVSGWSTSSRSRARRVPSLLCRIESYIKDGARRR